MAHCWVTSTRWQDGYAGKGPVEESDITPILAAADGPARQRPGAVA